MAAHRNNTPEGVTTTGLPAFQPTTPHPRLVELIERRALRKKLERAVTVLIAVLDEIDADAEAEPSLGAPEQTEALSFTRAPAQVPGRDQRRWAAGTTDDREGADVQDEPHDPEPDEPWLASPEQHHNQRRWAAGAHDDRELVNEDGGDDDRVDGEPSLGAAENVDQRGWAQGGRRDLEEVTHA